MSDYSLAKAATSVWPIEGIAGAWSRLEPLVTPAELRSVYLFGLPLVSAQVDPTTGKSQRVDDHLLQHFIHQAVATVEADTSVDISPIDCSERVPYQAQDFDAWGYITVNRRPITKVRSISIATANNVDLFTFSNDWIEGGYLAQGIIHIVPLTLASTGGTMISANSAGGLSFLTCWSGGNSWIASYWSIKYTSGFADGMVPNILNQLIAIVAAKKVLQNLAATHAASQSVSIGIDGLSQSVSTPGPALYDTRIASLEADRVKMVQQVKKTFGQNFFIGAL